MKKIDMHLHVRAIEQKAPHISCAKDMIAHMEELHIEKGVLMSGGESECPFGKNEEMRTICNQHPKHFSWMCNLDFQNPDTIYERLSAYKKQGAIGIGELILNKRIDHPFLEAVFSAAESLHLPVTIHMSPEEGFKYGIVDEPGLPLLENILKRYPKLKILGHSQVFWIEISGNPPTDREGRYKTGKGPVAPGGRLIELFEKYPNLYGDLSANSAGKAIMRDEAFGLWFLERFSNRLFFATDMLTSDMVYPLGGWLDEQVTSGKLSKNAYENICYYNAKRVFGL